jgi:hypothetical protein
MRLGGGERDAAAAIVLGEAVRKRPPAPRPAEIQAIQMRDLAVGAIADDGGLEQRRRSFAATCGPQSTGSPAGSLSLATGCTPTACRPG